MRGVIILIFTASVCIEIIRALETTFHFKPLFQAYEFNDVTNQPEVGASLIIGSFFFGIGMQIGSGCSTGTLVRMGEGFIKSWIVVACFIAGGTLGTTNAYQRWRVSLPKTDGPILLTWWENLLLQIGLYIFTYVTDLYKYLKKKYCGEEMPLVSELSEVRLLFEYGIDPSSVTTLAEGRWTTKYRPVFVSMALGFIASLYFLCVGTTIAVAQVYPYIGASFLKLCGLHPEKWEFFGGKIIDNIMDEPTFLSDCFIVLGSFVASTITRDFGVFQTNNAVELIKAPFGGLIMGLGAKMAHGCNVGAMLGGISCRSLHGYVWTATATLGCATALYTEKLIRYIIAKKREREQSGYSPIQ